MAPPLTLLIHVAIAREKEWLEKESLRDNSWFPGGKRGFTRDDQLNIVLASFYKTVIFMKNPFKGSCATVQPVSCHL